MTNDEIKVRIANRGYPDLLSEGMVDEAIESARSLLGILLEVTKYASFNITSGQNTYGFFNPLSADYIDGDGLRVQDVIWKPFTSSWDDTDVFSVAPFLQAISIYGIESVAFETPTDYSIFAENMMLWRKRYSTGGWEQITDQNGADLLLLPTPRVDSMGYVFYTAKNTDPALEDNNKEAFLELVEYYLSPVMGNMFGIQVGIQMGAFKDLGRSAKYWDDKQQIHLDKAMALLGMSNNSGIGAVGSRS